ncbi:MAG: SNF2-related protein [Saprospiraceae bacterium]|nr:ATP-dependent helicase [Lewinella sp.]
MQTRPNTIVFNLSEAAQDIFLPVAFIVKLDRHDSPTYIQQRALPETLGGFNLEITPTLQRLFALIEQLTLENIEKQFCPPRRKTKPLSELLEDQEVRRAIHIFVHRRLDELLTVCVEHGYGICWEAERKSIISDLLLEPHKQELQPELSFEKTGEGVTYQLRLKEGRQTWQIHTKEVVVLTNTPAWIVVGYRLYSIAHINGFMVKPFRNKDVIQIPRSSVTAYFKQFIYKVASKVEIEASGFEVVQYSKLEGCELEPVKLLFTEKWGLSVHMAYQLARFNWSDKKMQMTTLKMGDGQEEISILQVKRDKVAENIFVAQLRRLGLLNLDGSYFQLNEDAGQDLLDWVIDHRSELKELGFKLKMPQVEGRTIALYRPTIQVNTTRSNDWFDIYGEVAVGPHRIPFLDIARYIKNENPYFLLPDGSYFLIPEEWMNRYREIVMFGRFQGGKLQLAKSQFPLLESLGIEAASLPAMEDSDLEFSLPDGLQADLRPYQLDGVRWMAQHYHNGLGACLADDMGLGKTLQTIAILLHAKENKLVPAPVPSGGGAQLDLFSAPSPDAEFLKPLNALIVLPASLVFNWKQEIRKFAPVLSTYNHTGPKRHRDARLLGRFDVILTTYQTALRDIDLLQKLEYEYIVLDESQQIKNRESKVFQAINKLNGKHKISLSGTPIENSLADLWSQMQFINPDLLGSFRFFKKEFITPIEKNQDEDRKDRLRTLVQPYLLRRTKEEVAKDLPPLSTQLFYSDMEPEQKKLYEREKSAARNYLLENFAVNDPQYRIMVLQSLTKLRQIANHPALVEADFGKASGKFNDVLEHWSVIRKAGHKALFFSSFVKYLELFRSHFETDKQAYAWLSGSLSSVERQREIDRFESNPDISSFLISIKSGGTGLNLTAADYVFILDPWWNPTIENQAIARAHRIGQEKQVIAVKFIVRESIEEKILALQEKKAQLAEDIIGNSGKMDFSREELELLLE